MCKVTNKNSIEILKISLFPSQSVFLCTFDIHVLVTIRVTLRVKRHGCPKQRVFPAIQGAGDRAPLGAAPEEAPGISASRVPQHSQNTDSQPCPGTRSTPPNACCLTRRAPGWLTKGTISAARSSQQS